jgi:hypothetical protein
MSEFSRLEVLSNDAVEVWNITGVDNDVVAQEVLNNIDNRLSDDDTTTLVEDTHVDIEAPETKKLIKELTEVFTTRNLVNMDLWGQIHRKYESTQLHDHPYDVAWVYYVKTPPKGGAIDFLLQQGHHRPRRIPFHPKAGELIMFPHWVLHQVLKNLDDEYRISIAGNAKYEG